MWRRPRAADRRSFMKYLGWLTLSACTPASSRVAGGVTSRPALAMAAQSRSAAPSSVTAERAQRVFDAAVGRARERLSGAPLGPAPSLPPPLRDLPYDTYRQIRFQPERSLFRGEGLEFEAQLFHRGFSYARPVAVFLHDREGPKPLAFDPSRFVYPDGIDLAGAGDIGHAGLRLHAPINQDDYFDEVLVFLGASYFRAVPKDLAYGLSARCLALDSGLDRPEEFPEIVALHLVTPEPGESGIHVIADVRSARLEAAFRFFVTPGAPTVLDVEGVVLSREELRDLGLAPLTSMFLFGEDRVKRFDDFRGEVHDSDGLLLLSGRGERIFRPLRNPHRTTLSSFALDAPAAFGLVQRDRSFASYQDLEARYDRRPSAWVEPVRGFDAGAVRLLEIATKLETDDNIGAFFVPAAVEPETRFAYRLSFGDQPSFAARGGRVVGFRSGTPHTGQRHRARDGSRIFVADFESAELRRLDMVEARVDATNGTVTEVRTEKNPIDGSFRLVFKVAPAGPDVELRAFLHRGERVLSETLSYLFQPAGELERPGGAR